MNEHAVNGNAVNGNAVNENAINGHTTNGHVTEIPEDLLNEDRQLDEAISHAIPQGRIVAIVRRDGRNPLYRGFKLSTELPDDHGVRSHYYMKVWSCERHDRLAQSEYICQHELAQHIPRAVYSPICYGTFQSDPKKSFYLTYFRNMDDTDKDNKVWLRADEIIPLLCDLNRLAPSPWSDSFGYRINTFNYNWPQVNQWTVDWALFFSRSLRNDFTMVRRFRRPDPAHEEFDRLARTLLDKVVPRLLRPLQNAGRTIRPTMVIGDLVRGSLQVDRDTGYATFPDLGACYFGHNELGLIKICNSWAAEHPDERERLLRLYEQHIGFSEPVDEVNDRLKLYFLKTNTRHCVHYRPMRDWILKTMRDLVNRFGG